MLRIRTTAHHHITSNQPSDTCVEIYQCIFTDASPWYPSTIIYIHRLPTIAQNTSTYKTTFVRGDSSGSLASSLVFTRHLATVWCIGAGTFLRLGAGEHKTVPLVWPNAIRHIPWFANAEDPDRLDVRGDIVPRFNNCMWDGENCTPAPPPVPVPMLQCNHYFIIMTITTLHARSNTNSIHTEETDRKLLTA